MLRVVALLSIVTLHVSSAPAINSNKTDDWYMNFKTSKYNYEDISQKKQDHINDAYHNHTRNTLRHNQYTDISCSMGLLDGSNRKLKISSRTPNSRSVAGLTRQDEQSTRNTYGSWCVPEGGQSWIEVYFQSAQLLAGIVTQGSPSSDRWVTKFSIACGNERGEYKDYTENGMKTVFRGNSNRNGKAFNVFSDNLSCHSVQITPRSWHSAPCMRMELLHSGCYAPNDYKFYVKSQGADDGWACYIYVNSVQRAIFGRGFCVVIFNPKTAAIQAGTFDLYGDPSGETDRMISFLNNADEYSVIAIAVRDAVTREGVALASSLRSKLNDLGAVGVSCDLTTYGFRDSLAFIGQNIANNVERPDWVNCQHVKRYNGYAVVHATIKTSSFFNEN